MDYEKKYDEALERAKNLYKDAIDMGENIRAKQCEIIFPELKESEGEKIRKSILIYLDWLEGKRGCAPRGEYSIRDMIAWLKKQGRQKPISFDDSAMIDPYLNDYCCKIYNALHKENCGILSYARLQHLAKDIFKWCKENQDEQKKELKKNKQKSAWSEEDETALGDALWCCKQAASIAKDENDMGNAWYAEKWLKSLKQRMGE